MKLIEMNMDKIMALCEKYKVAKLWVFGSILTDRFNDDSDVDLLVIFDRSKIALLEMADVFFDFKYELEDLFKREVDLTVYSAIQNKYFKQEVDEKNTVMERSIKKSLEDILLMIDEIDSFFEVGNKRFNF